MRETERTFERKNICGPIHATALSMLSRTVNQILSLSILSEVTLQIFEFPYDVHLEMSRHERFIHDVICTEKGDQYESRKISLIYISFMTQHWLRSI